MHLLTVVIGVVLYKHKYLEQKGIKTMSATPGSWAELPAQQGTEEDTQDAITPRPGISDKKLIGGLLGGTAALTAAAATGIHYYSQYVDRPVHQKVQIGAEHPGEEDRIAGFNEGGVKFEMTPDGGVLITLPPNTFKQLEGMWHELDATVKNPDGSSQVVDVVNPQYHGMGDYSGDVLTAKVNPEGQVFAEKRNPDNWEQMVARPEPGAPATLKIEVDGPSGPHSEYKIIKPTQAPPAP